MKVIGISGKAGHGKDEVGRIIKSLAKEMKINTFVWSTANPMKARVYAAHKGQFSINDIWHQKPRHIRKLLQLEGTENGRHIFGDDFWLYQSEAFLSVLEANDIGLTIFPDVRFSNEVYFTQLGGEVPSRFSEDVIETLREDMGYTDDEEKRLLLEDTSKLIELDSNVLEMTDFVFNTKRQTGCCLRIVSDRETLDGEEKEHESETALDNFPLSEYTGIITNNKDTTKEDLYNQISPFVYSLLGD